MLLEADNRELSVLMSGDPWFGAVSLNVQEAMLRRARQVRCHSQFLFRQGDPRSGFFGVVRGVLKVSTLSDGGKADVPSQQAQMLGHSQS